MNIFFPKHFRKNFLISLTILFIFIILSYISMYVLFRFSGIDYKVKFSPISTTLSLKSILFTNFMVILISLLGVFTFKITSIFILVTNGCSIGFILAANSITTGKLWYFLKIILAHGTTEIVTICLAAAIGLYGKRYIFLFSKKEIYTHIILILFLWFISGIIETNITPLLW